MADTQTMKNINPHARKNAQLKKEIPLHLMLLLPVLFVFIFSYVPIAGLSMAFMDYLPGQGFYIFGSEWVGFSIFQRMFESAKIWEVLRNTVVIALLKIVTGTAFPILVAILLNEVSSIFFKRSIQTAIFLPYFISWVIMAGVLLTMFQVDSGMVTSIMKNMGINLDFFGDAKSFPVLLIISNLWKDAGYGVIIYIAAITTIDTSLYEAAKIDGAGYTKRCLHVTLPGMLPIIILQTVLNMGNILNAGFEQVYNLYNEVVYETGDILDTFIYRMAFEGAMDYSLATAVGLFKSVISLIFISGAYYLAYKKFDYRIF